MRARVSAAMRLSKAITRRPLKLAGAATVAAESESAAVIGVIIDDYALPSQRRRLKDVAGSTDCSLAAERFVLAYQDAVEIFLGCIQYLAGNSVLSRRRRHEYDGGCWPRNDLRERIDGFVVQGVAANVWHQRPRH